MAPNKVFSEDEIQRIIKRATELQKKEARNKEKQESGLTMDELLSIGEEAGLDIQYLKTAALEMRGQKIVRHSGITDTHIFEEREFNTEAPEDLVWDDVIAELTHHFGGDTFGSTKEHHQKKEWTHTSVSGIETIVSLNTREGQSKLRLSQRVGLGSPLTEGVGYGAILAFLLTVVGMAVFEPSIRNAVVMGAGLWGISSLLVYTLDVAWRKRKLKSLRTLADKILDQLPSSIQEVKKKVNTTNTSSINIESEDVYGNEESGDNLNNQLRE
ncbi:MAG: hypothetical protein ED557_07325 [Balneola sp.]|nr:MAG: hypothetical protein ED557_07325 [Balneola sp.]